MEPKNGLQPALADSMRCTGLIKLKVPPCRDGTYEAGFTQQAPKVGVICDGRQVFSHSNGMHRLRSPGTYRVQRHFSTSVPDNALTQPTTQVCEYEQQG